MRTDSDFSPSGLLDLDPREREVLVHLARRGPADAVDLASTLGLDASDVKEVLRVLASAGRVRLSDDGQARAVMGRVTPRTALPDDLWRALGATDRVYSERDIATLRTVMPILQFARRRLARFADHGPGHSLRVKAVATQLGYLVGLSDSEHDLLRTGALFHDVGNVLERERHNEISQEAVERLSAQGELPFSRQEAHVIGLLCRWHRRDYDPERVDEIGQQTVRTGLMASVLRVADATDIDHRRFDYSDRLMGVLEQFYPQELPFWTSLREVLGVRVICTPAVRLQAFVEPQATDNMQVDMLREDLESTPLGWALDQIGVPNDDAGRAPATRAGQRPRALMAFPFEPHSLIMAALTRRHLGLHGYDSELLCYPQRAGMSRWLWRQALTALDGDAPACIVVIGDRPEPSVDHRLVRLVEQWRRAGTRVILLNRHEANWRRLPGLLNAGAEAVLGGDWAYFWGPHVSRRDLDWGRMAALCTRDPSQSTVGLTDRDETTLAGFLRVVYDAARAGADEAPEARSDVAAWSARAAPILGRVQENDVAYFASRAAGFADAYARLPVPGQVEGRVLRVEAGADASAAVTYWALEAAIEAQGRTPERAVAYRVPYAIATWAGKADPSRGGKTTQLLAISHWREEEAVPIRLLWPVGLRPRPVGNECAIQVRLPAYAAGRVVEQLVAACNSA